MALYAFTLSKYDILLFEKEKKHNLSKKDFSFQ